MTREEIRQLIGTVIECITDDTVVDYGIVESLEKLPNEFERLKTIEEQHNAMLVAAQNDQTK